MTTSVIIHRDTRVRTSSLTGHKPAIGQMYQRTRIAVGRIRKVLSGVGCLVGVSNYSSAVLRSWRRCRFYLYHGRWCRFGCGMCCRWGGGRGGGEGGGGVAGGGG